MDISVSMHGPVKAKTGSASGNNHWVKIFKSENEYSDVTLFVGTAEAAQAISDAVNAAFPMDASDDK